MQRTPGRQRCGRGAVPRVEGTAASGPYAGSYPMGAARHPRGVADPVPESAQLSPPLESVSPRGAVPPFDAVVFDLDGVVTDTASVTALVENVEKAFGQIDILVNNVGGSSAPSGGFAVLEDEHWQAALNANLLAAVRFDPQKARGLKGALESLQGQVYGPILLGIVALGLVAFGIYSMVEMRYRRIE